MPENNKQVVKARTESHSDVAKSDPAKAHQAALTQRQFGDALLRRLRDTEGELRLRNFREEWIPTDDGMVYEISADAEVGEPTVTANEGSANAPDTEA
jgi:hypothetical protein